MEEPRAVELPGYRVVQLAYRGPPPPSPQFLAHWQDFNRLVNALRLTSEADDIQAIGYAPPDLVPRDVLVYYACLPVAKDFSRLLLDELRLGDVPGGTYVLCAGPITELPALLLEAKRFAASHGLAIERGRIEIYRPIPPGADLTPVDVGYRVHD